MRLFRASVLCLCALIALGATPALAKKKKKPAKLGPVTTVTANGNTVSNASAVSTATATCPSGTVAVGGGFASTRNPSTVALFTESYRNGTQAWTVSAIIAGSTGLSGSANAIAYCRPANRTISDVTGTAASEMGAFGSATATASCPAGQQLVAGGFQAEYTLAQSLLIEQNSSTQPGAWTVAGVNSNSGFSKTLTAHAYCMPGLRAPALVSTTASAPVSAGQTLTGESPACPVAKKPKKKKKKKKKKKPPQLLSGGGFSSPLATPSGNRTIYEDSLIGGTGWFVRSVNVISAVPSSATSQGICA